MRVTPKFLSSCLAILGCALALRLWQIELRPFHHDEGVNWHFIQELFNRGYYPYSHENYHGPFYFYVLGFVVWLFGDGETSFRMTNVIFGLILTALPLLYFRLIGERVALFASGFLAISSSLIFYSRYAIHETSFVLFQLWLAFALITWLWDRKVPQLYFAAVALALLIATKETFVINLLWFGLGLLFIVDPREIYRRFREDWAHVVRAYALFIFVLFGVFTGGFRWSEGLREMMGAIPQWIGRGTKSDVGHFKPFMYYFQDVLYPAEVMALIFPILALGWLALKRFTTTRSLNAPRSRAPILTKGFISIVLGAPVAITLVLSVVRGEPLLTVLRDIGVLIFLVIYWAVSLVVMFGIQMLFVVRQRQVALTSFLDHFWTGERHELFMRLFLCWTVGALFTYSLIPYKTPWLIMSATMPAAILGGFFFARCWEGRRLLAWGLIVVISVAQLRGTLKYNYQNYSLVESLLSFDSIPIGDQNGDKNPFVYVHTTVGMLEMLRDMKAYVAEKADAKILIGVDGHWPMPYYMRTFKQGAAYLHVDDPEKYRDEYDIIIADKTATWEPETFSRKYYRLNGAQESHVYFRKVQQ